MMTITNVDGSSAVSNAALPRLDQCDGCSHPASKNFSPQANVVAKSSTGATTPPSFYSNSTANIGIPAMESDSKTPPEATKPPPASISADTASSGANAFGNGDSNSSSFGTSSSETSSSRTEPIVASDDFSSLHSPVASTGDVVVSSKKRAAKNDAIEGEEEEEDHHNKKARRHGQALKDAIANDAETKERELKAAQDKAWKAYQVKIALWEEEQAKRKLSEDAKAQKAALSEAKRAEREEAKALADPKAQEAAKEKEDEQASLLAKVIDDIIIIEQRIEELDESAKKQKLVGFHSNQCVLVEQWKVELDEKKKENYAAGVPYSSNLLTIAVEAVEKGDDKTFKSRVTHLKTDYTALNELAEGTRMIQNKYLLHVNRRKKDRGDDGSEKFLKKFKELRDAKNTFEKKRDEELHLDIDKDIGGDSKSEECKAKSEEFKAFLCAIAAKSSDDIPGQWGGFTEDTAGELALEQLKEMLNYMVEECDGVDSIEDILPPGMSLEEFVRMDRDNDEEMNGLKKLALDGAREQAQRQFKETGIEIEEKTINRFSELSFLTSLNILIYYDDIVSSLLEKKAGVFRHPTSKKLMFFARIPNSLLVQFCIGSIKFQMLALDDYERYVHLKGNYVMQLFGGGEYTRLYSVEGDKIKRMKFFVTASNNLFSFFCQTRRDKSVAAEAKYTGGKRWSAHRLELTVLYNLGLGMNNCAWFRKYLRLESEETFEAKLSYYKYDHDAEERRRAQLKAKGWEDVKQAVSCDGDHLLGRMRMWMNASLFVMPCSHSWNQCMANVRAKMGCWGFAFAHVKYTGGN